MIFFKRFWPHPFPVSGIHLFLGAFGAGIGIVLTSLCTHAILGSVPLWLIAPVGASAVLIFAIPNSPLAQPWSVTGGNCISALAGIAAFNWIPEPTLACGVAASLAIILMYGLRCLHPPGGAVALTAILGGDSVHHAGIYYAFSPVLLNSSILMLLALFFNNLMGRRYPHALSSTEVKSAPVVIEVPVTRADLHAALMKGQFIDVDEDDLQDVLIEAEKLARQRTEKESYR
ncbi:HPP family protein [Candidatus Pantoea formicae]|uniref:HPP family protein n=1 Tax=Candidatus Pantoea formicae TaxID=2608355 RepID=UPI003ED956A0